MLKFLGNCDIVINGQFLRPGDVLSIDDEGIMISQELYNSLKGNQLFESIEPIKKHKPPKQPKDKPLPPKPIKIEKE